MHFRRDAPASTKVVNSDLTEDVAPVAASPVTAGALNALLVDVGSFAVAHPAPALPEQPFTHLASTVASGTSDTGGLLLDPMKSHMAVSIAVWALKE